MKRYSILQEFSKLSPEKLKQAHGKKESVFQRYKPTKKIVYTSCIFVHILRVYNPKNVWAHLSPMKKEDTTWTEKSP